MTTALGDTGGQPTLDFAAEVITWDIKCPIGGAGATGTLVHALNTAPAIANSGTGTFDCTNLPAAITDKGRYWFGLKSAAATVTECIVTAFDLNAGTMSFRTSKAGTAANPASGDIVWIYFKGERV